MKQISVIGLDLAKNVFQIHAVDAAGQVILRKQIRRNGMMRFFARLSPCLIGMEACGSAHYWHRVLSQLGHEVKMMPPVFVKPYPMSYKYYLIEAEAIC